jgi:spermidine dehydrogenase
VRARGCVLACYHTIIPARAHPGRRGFDPARDIEAITVNRWPHGYADEGDMLTDPEWKGDDEKPWIIARQPLGRIAIANSDAERRAFADAAINQAHRAIRELLAAERG